MHNQSYRLPPEWAPQDAALLTWPRSDGDWSPDYAAVERCHAMIASAISLREKVIIACMDESHAKRIRQQVSMSGGRTDRLYCYPAMSNDAWCRDHGPITVSSGSGHKLLDFIFNGWGGKYPAGFDNSLTRRLAAAGAFGTTPLESVDFVLEGGSIEVDGYGSLLTTASCLLSTSRNPRLGRHDIEHLLKNRLGVEQILWLEHGAIEGDDTDGHIDTLARFCYPETIAYQACDVASDPHFETLRVMAAELSALRNNDGKPYKLVPLPWPQPIFDAKRRRLPATYANFLIINGAVLVPTYGDAADTIALSRLQQCFPDREIIGIPCRPLIHQYGSLHCVTMQLPAGVLKGEDL